MHPLKLCGHGKNVVLVPNKASEEKLIGFAQIAFDRIDILDEDILHVRAIKSGDPDSFEYLVEKYKSFVFGVIRSMVYDQTFEQDLAQESFLNAYKGIGQFREQSVFKTWLYRITYNVCLNHIRKQKSDRTIDTEINLDTMTDKSRPPDCAHESNQLRSVLIGVMKELQPKYRSILHLHYFEDMQYDEISVLTGMPIGTVKSHLHRAREQVRVALENRGWIDGGIN